MFDILIKNGYIVDGTGNPWYRSDLAVDNGKIIEVKQKISGEANTVINASGLIVSPGFIDLHTHTDRSILQNNLAKSSIMAGVTTEGIGNCGSTFYGFPETYSDQIHDSSGLEIDLMDLISFRRGLNEKGIGINLAPFAGHNTIRISVMGKEGEGGERIVPSDNEITEMSRLVEESMKQGAFGMTTGLRYPPGRNALTEEVIKLAKIVARHNGMYMSHIRGESETLIESVKEFIEVCEKAGVRGCLSHHKATLPENWGKPITTIRLLKEAREKGIDIICDAYPWNFSSSANICRWLISGWGRNPGIDGNYVPSPLDLKTLLDDLRDPVLWARIKEEAQNRREVDEARYQQRLKDMEKYHITPSAAYDPKNFEVITYSKSHPELVGMRFSEAAGCLGIGDYWEAVKKIFLDDGGHTYTAGGGMCDEDITTILQCPYCAVSTDGSTRDMPSIPIKPSHPRNYGTFAKILELFVREKKILSLEDAIRKMTSLPANFLGLKDRGIIHSGQWADITIFDHEKIQNSATYSDPDRHPVGIKYVIVNGEVAAKKGERTNNLSGKVLVNKS